MKITTDSWKTADVFSDPLWKGHYSGDLLAFQERTLEFLNNSNDLNNALEEGGGASSSSDNNMPHIWPEAKDYYNWLMEGPSYEIWCHWNYKTPEQRQIERSWANLHPNGAWTKEHTHGEADQVAVLYLDVPPNSGNLEVHNPLFYHWQGTRQKAGTNSWTHVTVQTGDVVIFPGWLLHRTEKNNSDKHRITINTNIQASRIGPAQGVQTFLS